MEFYLFLPGQWWDRSRPVMELYDEIVQQAELAEELGYDGVWLAEQNLVNFLAAPDPLQLAAMIADRTNRLRVGIAVLVLPFHHPLRLAGQVAQLDQLSHGRFDVAAGRGASPYQMRQYETELPEGDSREFFDEHLKIMMRHWQQDGAISHDGRFFKYPNATVLPPPVQRPYPRTWIAALSASSMEWAVKLGLDTNFINSPFREPFSHVESVYGAFERAMQDIGRPRDEAKFAVNRMTFVGETEADAREILNFVLMNHRVIDQQLDDVEKVRSGDYAVENAVRKDEPGLDEMYQNIVYGDCDLVREKLRPYHALGIDHFSAWHNVGQSADAVMKSMEIFAREIMPEFKDR